jgi:ankyrin repeat protein
VKPTYTIKRKKSSLIPTYTNMSNKDQHLLAAAKKREWEEVKRLLQEGANAAYEQHVEGTWGAYTRVSPIHYALKSYDKLDLEVIALLLEKGAKVNAQHANYDWRGCGSKQTAFEMALELALRLDNADLLKLFLKHGGNADAEGVSDAHTMRYDGRRTWRALHTAVRQGRLGCVKALIEAGAQVNATATAKGASEYGSRDNTIETPLHIACSKTNRLKDFLEKKKKKAEREKEKQKEKEKKEKEKEKENNEDEAEVESEEEEEDEYEYEDEDEDTHNIDEQEKIALLAKLVEEDCEIVRLLLNAGADVNCLQQHIDNVHIQVESPTTDPREEGYIPSVKPTLVKQSALHIAIQADRPDIVTLLLAHGADLSAKYLYGDEVKTAWDLAATIGPHMYSALAGTWTPKNHRWYPLSFRQGVKTLLLCAQRQQWPLPKEMIHLIIGQYAAMI